MSLESVTKFWEWFDETRKDLSIRQIEERAGCPRGGIGNPYRSKEDPTTQVCISIADGLEINREEVLTQAGVLKPEPPNVMSLEDARRLFNQLSPEQRGEILALMRTLAEMEEKVPGVDAM